MTDIERIMDELKKIEGKLDRVLEKTIPEIRVDVARIHERTSHQAKMYTLIGGILAVLTSIGVSAAALLLK